MKIKPTKEFIEGMEYAVKMIKQANLLSDDRSFHALSMIQMEIVYEIISLKSEMEKI